MRKGYALQSGFLLYRFVSLLCGLLLVSALGQALLGQYVAASLQVCALVAVRRGVWWLLTRRGRNA
jgi:hypothetical protein